MSLRTRLILSFSVVVASLVLFLVISVSRDNSRQINNYMLRGGMLGYQAIVNNLEDYYRTHNSWDGVDQNLEKLQMGKMMGNGLQGDQGKFTLTDIGWKIIWSSSGEIVGSVIDNDFKKNAISLQTKPENIVGYLVVSGRQTFQPAEVSPLINNLKITVIRSGLIAGIFAILLAIILSNSLTKPIKKLNIAAVSLSHGDLSARVDTKGSDEISHLGKTFNEMAANLGSAEARKKAMTADIAHELRSPLAVQKAQLEAMQDGIAPLTNENLQIVIDQTNFLTRLVDDLRTLALVDAGELPLQIEKINIVDLIKQVNDRFLPQAKSQEVNLIFSNQTDMNIIFIEADPDRLVQIIGNLISNALHHTPAKGDVIIDLQLAKESILISVKDTGCGIPPEDLPYLFERFYRGDKSRNRENTGSTGLGLSIARHLARVHGGELTAENGTEKGAIFTFILPKKH